MGVEKLRHYWGIYVLIAWGALIIALQLLRLSPYGIDETAARALLINWSVADNVVNPIVVMGAPDLRAFLFLPLGVYWTGSFLAVKVYMLLVLFGAVTLLFRWSRELWGEETALLSSGLFLISPLALMQVNAIGAGPFLLLGFGLGAWLDKTYRAKGKSFSGSYFGQLLLIVTLVSMHPAGLAYPLALAWEWWRDPMDQKHRKQVWIGIVLATLCTIVFRFGWPAMAWGVNPLLPLADLLMGRVPGEYVPNRWAYGLVSLALLLCVLYFSRRRLLESLLMRTLTLSIIVGLTAADLSWALLVLAMILYPGMHLLIQANSALGTHSFAGQRGMVMAILFVTATAFMLGDRASRSAIINESLDPHDEIIRALTTETEDIKDEFNTSSQWPARTMLALKKPVFPLPPAAADPESLMRSLGKIDFIVFDPEEPRHRRLREQFALLSGPLETLLQQPNGVIIRVRDKNTAENSKPPAQIGG